jgi:hypothetical protein
VQLVDGQWFGEKDKKKRKKEARLGHDRAVLESGEALVASAPGQA